MRLPSSAARCQSKGVFAATRAETARVASARAVNRVAAILFVLFLECLLAAGQNNVLTQGNDVTRSGLNPNETILTPANVNVAQFGKLFTQNVDGIVVAQPLYASHLLMADGLVHNVVYVVTQHNTVYAFDADNNQGSNAAPIWSVSLNGAGTSDPIADYGCTGTHFTEIGITGTPVIDPGVTTLYVVAKTVNGNARNFSLHALDVTSGRELLGGPLVITGNVPSGNGSGTFGAVYQMQRPALLYENGEVYIGFGGNGCDEYAYNGWLFAYNAQTLNQDAAFLVTPNGTRGSLWGGGEGPSADEFGNIYAVTANGTFDGPNGKNDYGDTVLKLGWTGSAFGVADYFTPYNQLQLANGDLDLGSAGALILPDQPGNYPHELIAGGKQGTLYVVNRDNLGQFNAASDNVIQELTKIVPGELAGALSYWNGSAYVGSTDDYIKQFSLIAGQLTTGPVSQTTVSFGINGPSATTISANGTSNGILWALKHNSSAALYAFDPTNLATEFYDTTKAAASRDKLGGVIRFATPTISNGKVYVGGTSAITVYGLLPALTAVAGNNQTGHEKQQLPVGLTVLASDSYMGTPIMGASVTCKDGNAGGVFTPSATQTTNSSGNATFNYQLPGAPKNIAITCSSPGLLSTVFTETCIGGAATRLAISSGNNQSGYRGTPLAAPLVVQAVDAGDHGVAGVSISFTDNGAGGSFSANPVVTGGSKGTATTQYTAGANLGSVTVTASASGLKSVNLKATIVPGPASSVAVQGGNNQSATVRTALPQALSVLVTDSYGSPVAGVAVTFGDGGAGGTFGGSNPVNTGSNGVAQQTYTLAKTSGAVTINASAAGVSTPATFSETATAGTASSITVTGGNNQMSSVGTTLLQPLTVSVADQYGNPVSGAAVTFSDGGAGGMFGNSNPQNTNNSGNASQTYTLPTAPVTLTITASVAGVTSPASFTETAVTGLPAAILVSAGNNQSAQVGTALPQPLSAVVTDQYGNPVANVAVTFSDGDADGTFGNPNPENTSPTGTATQTYTLPTAAGTISITATAAGVATPATFTETATPAQASAIVLTGGNYQSAPRGSTLQALTVKVTDHYGNGVSGAAVTFSDGGAGGSFSYTNPVTTGAGGLASQIYTLPPSPGTITITAAAAGVVIPAIFTETSQ